MKKIKLLEVTLQELDGKKPVVGDDVTIRGVLYHVMEVSPPKTKSAKWRRRPQAEAEQKWQLLVQEVTASESKDT